jgi:hypothetical protein
MLRTLQWLDSLPQTGTPSWKKPKRERLGRSRSASCPVAFPPRPPPIAPTYSPLLPRPNLPLPGPPLFLRSRLFARPHPTRSMVVPTNRTTDPRTPATISTKAFFLVQLDLTPAQYIPQPPGTWCSVCGYPCRYPFIPGASLSSGPSETTPPYQSAHLLEFAGRGDDAHVFRDFRSPSLAWRRDRSEKEKYGEFRSVNRGQLLAARSTAVPPQRITAAETNRFCSSARLSTGRRAKRTLYKLAQEDSLPLKYHRRHVDRIDGTLDRRREERKHRNAILEAELEDFRLKTWPKDRRHCRG